MPDLPFDAQESHVRAQQVALFDSMAEGVLVLDAQGGVQMANPAFIRLFDISSDPAGKTLIEVLRLREILELAEEAERGRQALERELRLSGLEERWFQINASPITHGDDRWLGTILVFHELTRLKRLERARQDFVANVSHELRTPLSHIRGYVETLLSGAKDDPQIATRFLQTIERNAARLQLLIEDLLTISELESGRVKLNVQAVSLRAVVDKVFEDFKGRAASKSIALLNQSPELTLYADLTRLEQVFSNLLDNAIKYGRAGGCVTVEARALENGKAEVCVRDDGPGLPAESLERIFERFYRVDTARSREQGGTGLGLSIVKHIVQSHGGRVWAKSEPGQGAAFYFTVPRLA